MKKLAVTTAALLGGTYLFVGIGYAQHADHQTTTPADLKWAPIPAIPGGQIAVIEGPMDKAGVPFTVRLKFPANAKVPPHWHSTTEHVTVISGVLNLGVGDSLDTSRSKALGPGSFSVMPPSMHHFGWFSEETVVQLHGIGPWTVTYVNPVDDPKSQAAAAPPTR